MSDVPAEFIWVWLVAQDGENRIRKWDIKPFPEATHKGKYIDTPERCALTTERDALRAEVERLRAPLKPDAEEALGALERLLLSAEIGVGSYADYDIVKSALQNAMPKSITNEEYRDLCQKVFDWAQDCKGLPLQSDIDGLLDIVKQAYALQNAGAQVPEDDLKTISAGLDAALSATWDGHYSGKGVTIAYAQNVDEKVKKAHEVICRLRGITAAPTPNAEGE